MKRNLAGYQATYIVSAVVGGLALGIGVGRLIYGISIGAGVWTVLGVVLLWWAFTGSRKYRSGTPESELDGSHTIE